jgi:hypothetical protein
MSAADTGMGAFVSPRSAAGAVADRQKNLNTRYVPPQMESVAKLSEETQVYIFNVGPWAHNQFTGAGRFHIPACEKGKQYSEPVIIPGIFSHLYPQDEKSMRRIDEEGYKVALDVVGIGVGLAPANSLTRYGVAISRQWPPTKSEVAQAFEALRVGELNTLIAEANSAQAQGEVAVNNTIRARHYEAAQILKKTTAECPWIGRATANTSHNVDCKFCGEPMKPNLPVCPNCQRVVNKKLLAELEAKE